MYGKGENDSCIGGLPALNISILPSFLLFETPINADPGKRSGVEGVACSTRAMDDLWRKLIPATSQSFVAHLSGNAVLVERSASS
jgi:hypothetical protein